MPTLYEQALAAATPPEAAALDDAIAKAEKKLRKLQQTPAMRTTADVVGGAVAALLDGGPAPDDLGDQVLDLKADHERAQAEAGAWRQVLEQLRNRRERVGRVDHDAALEFLAGQLPRILDAARSALAECGDVRSNDAAIDATPEQQAAWRRLRDAVTEYRELRAAQPRFTGPAIGDERTVGAVLHIRDAWRIWDDNPASGKNPGPPPWPHQIQGNSYRVEVGLEFVRWAFKTGAELWLPSSDELDDSLAERDEYRRGGQPVSDYSPSVDPFAATRNGGAARKDQLDRTLAGAQSYQSYTQRVLAEHA